MCVCYNPTPPETPPAGAQPTNARIPLFADREAPPGLRGIKPGVTKEPWMHDKMLYNKDSLFKEDGPSSSGDHHRAAGATAGSWDGRFLRIGEHQPAWESWGASLSA